MLSRLFWIQPPFSIFSLAIFFFHVKLFKKMHESVKQTGSIFATHVNMSIQNFLKKFYMHEPRLINKNNRLRHYWAALAALHSFFSIIRPRVSNELNPALPKLAPVLLFVSEFIKK
jgi:hypothetical protein